MISPKPLTLIAGPCVIEGEQFTLDIARELKRQLKGFTDAGEVDFFFKASFDKANRTSIQSFRGPGLVEGLKTLSKVKNEVGLRTLTDFHTPEQARKVAEAVDFLQIPAFLCRQTDMIVAGVEAARDFKKNLNVKKGQFLAPWDVKNIVDKARSIDATWTQQRLFLTERGVSFGYNRLVVDMTSFQTMQQWNVPVIYDATHSIQLPGAATGGTVTGGQREFLEVLARSAMAAGADGLFLECHPNPSEAKSDGSNALYLDLVGKFISQLLEFRKLAFSLPKLLPEAGGSFKKKLDLHARFSFMMNT